METKREEVAGEGLQLRGLTACLEIKKGRGRGESKATTADVIEGDVMQG